MTKRLYEYDATVADLDMPPAVRRELVRRRLVASRGEGPRMVGPITPGVEICGLTNGQFSMVDLVQHVLEQIGPADLACSTWTTGLYEQEQAAAFYRDGRIRSARWILDPVIFGRRPESAGTLVRAFGVENFRAVNTHAKFAVLTNEAWAVVIRSSMNLNRNERIENFDLSESRELAGFFLRLVDAIFAVPPDKTAGKTRQFFESLVDAAEAADAGQRAKWGDVVGELPELSAAGGLGDLPVWGT